MRLLPKVRRCPRCRAMNLLRVNGIIYENIFKIYADWTIKKKFKCRKCKIELGLFVHKNVKNKEKLVWIDLLKCEENYHDRLTQLQIYKEKYKKQSDKFYETQKEINTIQNKITLDQVKIKIKAKIQNRGMLI